MCVSNVVMLCVCICVCGGCIHHLHGVSYIITEAIITMATLYYMPKCVCVCTVWSVHVDVCMLVRVYDSTMYVQPGVDLIRHFQIGRFPPSDKYTCIKLVW